MSQPGSSPPPELQIFVFKELLQSGPCTLQEIYDKLPKELNTNHLAVDEALIAMLDDGMIIANATATPIKFDTTYDEQTKAAMLRALSNLVVQSPREVDAAFNSNVTEYQFPVPSEIATRVAQQSRFLADLACLSSAEIISRLRVRYRFTDFPHLNRLATAILDQPLSCLSFDDDQYWLTFNKSGHPVHLRGVCSIPLSLYDRYQIRAVPGLEEFLQHFGGMSNGWLLPASNYFLVPADSVCVSRDDLHYDWGTIGDWTGSLLFYQGATGDQIVIHPDGTPGAWFHDVGWESLDEVAFQPVGMTFPMLIDHLATCITLPTESPTWKESPFYY